MDPLDADSESSVWRTLRRSVLVLLLLGVLVAAGASYIHIYMHE